MAKGSRTKKAAPAKKRRRGRPRKKKNTEIIADAADQTGGRDPAKKKSAENFLALYFREMAALSVLKPEEEFRAAQQIEAL